MRDAFTLIEAIIVIGIVAVLAVAALPNLLGPRNRSDLNATAQQIIASLREAQSNAMAQLQGGHWGVRFSNADPTAPFYEIFKGPSYDSGTVVGHYRLPPTLGLTIITPASSVIDVRFSPISGAAAPHATIKIYVFENPSLAVTIKVDANGMVY